MQIDRSNVPNKQLTINNICPHQLHLQTLQTITGASSAAVPGEGLVQEPLQLLLTALLCNMLTSIMPQLNEELRVAELPNAEGNREFQVRK